MFHMKYILFYCIETFLPQASRSAGAQGVTVKSTRCGFDLFTFICSFLRSGVEARR